MFSRPLCLAAALIFVAAHRPAITGGCGFLFLAERNCPSRTWKQTSVSLGLVRAEPVFAIVGFLFYPITLSMVANQFVFTIDGTGLHHLKVEGHITTGLLVRLAVAVGIKSNV